MSNPFDDGSRWAVMGGRFETPDFLREAMNEMMREWLQSLPEDSPTRQLADKLDWAPGWDPMEARG